MRLFNTQPVLLPVLATNCVPHTAHCGNVDLTSSDGFLPRRCAINKCCFKTLCHVLTRCQDRQEKSEDVKNSKGWGNQSFEGHALIQWIVLVLCQQQETFLHARLQMWNSVRLGWLWQALTNSFRGAMVQSMHVTLSCFEQNYAMWSRNVKTVKRGQKMYRTREL